MEYRLDKNELLGHMRVWNRFLKNDYDLIASKLMRGTRVDFDDCALLARAHRGILSFEKLTDGFAQMLKYNTVGEERIKQNFDSFMARMTEEGLYGQTNAAE